MEVVWCLKLELLLSRTNPVLVSEPNKSRESQEALKKFRECECLRAEDQKNIAKLREELTEAKANHLTIANLREELRQEW